MDDRQAPAPPAIAEQMVQLWQMPFTLFFQSWNIALGAFTPTAAVAPPREDPETEKQHEQLVVPEPVKQEGDEALFA